MYKYKLKFLDGRNQAVGREGVSRETLSSPTSKSRGWGSGSDRLHSSLDPWSRY